MPLSPSELVSPQRPREGLDRHLFVMGLQRQQACVRTVALPSHFLFGGVFAAMELLEAPDVMVGRLWGGAHQQSPAKMLSLAQTLGTGALETCRSGFCGRSTSTGCLQQAKPSRSWAARSCVPCRRSSFASVRPWVGTCCMPTWTSGSQVRHEAARARSLLAPGWPGTWSIFLPPKC